MTPDPVDLAQALLRLDTAGPDAREQPAVDLLAPLLADAGFTVATHAFAPGRPSLVARLEGGAGLPLVFSGHLDTVPVGAAPWRRPPLAGEIADEMLHGRGSADMKGGVAALVAAAVAAARGGAVAQPLVLVLTAGEEIGCLGALHLGERGALPRAAAVVVAEPTGNRLALGHRGALWLRASYKGRGAHGSVPHRGVNAIYAAADGIGRCRALRLGGADPLLGPTTLNVGTMEGGININSVPDHARFTLDIRSPVPGAHAGLRQEVAAALGPAAHLETLVDLSAVRTAPDDGLVAAVMPHLEELGLPTAPIAVPFFTDASALTGPCGAAAIIIGPGAPDMAHTTDECCPLHEIRTAAALFGRLAATRFSAPGSGLRTPPVPRLRA